MVLDDLVVDGRSISEELDRWIATDVVPLCQLPLLSGVHFCHLDLGNMVLEELGCTRVDWRQGVAMFALW